MAIFLLSGAGAAGALALSNNTLLGSDALKVGPGLLAALNCPGATGLNYTGGGSALGEAALITSSSQTVAPSASGRSACRQARRQGSDQEIPARAAQARRERMSEV